jgi:hypothetical protein
VALFLVLFNLVVLFQVLLSKPVWALVDISVVAGFALKSALWFYALGKAPFSLASMSLAVGARVSFTFLELAIHASNRQATFYGVHGFLVAQQFKLLATQTVHVHGSNDAIKVTAVEPLHSSFTSGAAAPYFGC